MLPEETDANNIIASLLEELLRRPVYQGHDRQGLRCVGDLRPYDPQEGYAVNGQSILRDEISNPLPLIGQLQGHGFGHPWQMQYNPTQGKPSNNGPFPGQNPNSLETASRQDRMQNNDSRPVGPPENWPNFGRDGQQHHDLWNPNNNSSILRPICGRGNSGGDICREDPGVISVGASLPLSPDPCRFPPEVRGEPPSIMQIIQEGPRSLEGQQGAMTGISAFDTLLGRTVSNQTLPNQGRPIETSYPHHNQTRASILRGQHMYDRHPEGFQGQNLHHHHQNHGWGWKTEQHQMDAEATKVRAQPGWHPFTAPPPETQGGRQQGHHHHQHQEQVQNYVNNMYRGIEQEGRGPMSRPETNNISYEHQEQQQQPWQGQIFASRANNPGQAPHHHPPNHPWNFSRDSSNTGMTVNVQDGAFRLINKAREEQEQEMNKTCNLLDNNSAKGDLHPLDRDQGQPETNCYPLENRLFPPLVPGGGYWPTGHVFRPAMPRPISGLPHDAKDLVLLQILQENQVWNTREA